MLFIALRHSKLIFEIFLVFLLTDNYGALKSDSTDGSCEADRVIIINKPQSQQFCNNKIRWVYNID